MQQRTTGGAEALGSMPDPLRQPTEYLLTFLNRIAMLDKEGFFQRPVREEEAPNYYSIIKQPMCFADMREKISSGSYQTWRQLRDDFNLIHENARRFNSNKTLVHRAALNLQKNGSKLLANFELEVRKALAVLHPLGTHQQTGAATGGLTATSATMERGGDLRMEFTTSPIASASVAGVALAVDQNGDGGGFDDGCQRPSLSGPPSPAGIADGTNLPMPGSLPSAGLAPHAFSSMLLPPTPRDTLVNYVSDEDDQPLLVVGTDAAAATAAAAASRSLPGLGPSHALPLDALLSQLRTTAVRVPYSRPGRRKIHKLTNNRCVAPGIEVATADCSGKAYANSSPILSKEWRQARRPVELKARWLELRMRELRSHQERLHTQISWLQQRQAAGGEGLVGAALAAGLGRPAVGVLVAASGLAAASCATERSALGLAAGEFMSTDRVSSSLYFRLRATPTAVQRAWAPGAQLVPGGLSSVDQSRGAAGCQAAAEAPAVAGSGVASSSRGASVSQSLAWTSAAPGGIPSTQPNALHHMMPQPPLTAPSQSASLEQQPGPGRPAAPMPPLLPQQLGPWDESESDKMLPGAAFASLELLDQRLGVVRACLQESFKFDPNRLSVGRTPGPYASRASSYQLNSSGTLAPGAQTLPTGPPASHGAVKRQSSGQGRRPGSLTVLTRFDSMTFPACKSTGGSGKRKRSEVELLTGDIGTPLAPYGRLSLDRSASATAIVIPPVRELPPDEFRSRVVAATTWSQHYHTMGPSALDSVPPEIQLVLRKRRRWGLGGIEEYEEDIGGIGPGSTRGLPGMSDDENGPLLGGGVGALGTGLCGYSDSGVGDDEGSSSSSEDTSDEAYAARHRFMEDEEHRRYAAVVAEGQRRRNKGGSGASGAQQNPSGAVAAAIQEKERAKVGNKTPRYSNSFRLKEGLMLVQPDLMLDAMDSGPPSIAYSHYPAAYQQPMLGMAASAMPPTPGSAPAPLLAHPQPIGVPQTAAQRTSSPPALLQTSFSGITGQQQSGTAVPASTTAPAAPAAMAPSPTASMLLAGPGQRLPQLPKVPPIQHSQLLLPCTSDAQAVVASVEGSTPATNRKLPPGSQRQAQEPPAAEVQPHAHTPPPAPPPSQAQPRPLAQPPPPPSQGTSDVQPPMLPSQPQEEQAQPPAEQQSQQQGVEQPTPVGSNPGQSSSTGAGSRSGTEAAALGLTARAASAQATEEELVVSTVAAEQPKEVAEAPDGTPKPIISIEPSGPRSEPSLAGAAPGQERGGSVKDATPEPAAAGGGSSANPASVAASATTSSAAVEARIMNVTPSGTAPAAAAMAAAAQHAAMSLGATSVGGSSFLSSSAAAAMLAQSPAMSMQFLSSIQGLGGGIGAGGSNNALSAAATSILLAAAAAASAGGQNAANCLMGNARTNALQQLAAGTPAAQVFANAAAAAAAAAAAGNSASSCTGLGQQGKQQQAPALFTAAASRGMPLTGTAQGQAALAAAAAAGGISGIGSIAGIGGLPAAFQSLSGFQQSLAGVTGFNFNLAGGGLGLGLQPGQRLTDGLGGLGSIMPQSSQHLQAHILHQGMQAQPLQALRQGQQSGQADGGRGAGRSRRMSRTTVVEEEDEDWGAEEEEEEAASPGARTRRSARAQRRASNGLRGVDGQGNGGQEATRQSRRRAAKGAHNWAVLLASDSSDDAEEEEEWAARRQQEGSRGRGRGRRSAG